MADNIAVEPSGHSDRVDVATDEIGGIHYPVYKQAYGLEGSTPVHVSPEDGLPVSIKDNTTSIVNHYAVQATATTTTLSADTAIDDYVFNVVSAAGFSVGDHVHIDTTNEEKTNPQITAINVNAITIDRRLDYVHLAGDTLTKVIYDMSLQAGTQASPQIYVVEPIGTEVWHITRLLFSMVHGTAGDLGLFGNLAALTNGVTLRVYINGVYETLTNWKINADLKADMYDVEFDTRSGGGGSFGTSGRGTFTQAGSILRLDAAAGDQIQVYVQDDLTALGFFTMRFQGHLSDV